MVTAEEGREFSFEPGRSRRNEVDYRFAPERGGTTVTESFEMLADLPWYLRLVERVVTGVKDRRADVESGMTFTLGRLKAAVEGVV